MIQIRSTSCQSVKFIWNLFNNWLKWEQKVRWKSIVILHTLLQMVQLCHHQGPVHLWRYSNQSSHNNILEHTIIIKLFLWIGKMFLGIEWLEGGFLNRIKWGVISIVTQKCLINKEENVINISIYRIKVGQEQI